MRRFLTTILAAVVLVLSCLPCADVLVSIAPHCTAANACADDDCDNQGDSCSPFCSCACCAALAMPQRSAINVPAAPEIRDNSFGAYCSGNVPEVTLPIWQPPQLG